MSAATICLRAQMALAFKTGNVSKYGDFGRPWGGGFNAELEVGWPVDLALDSCREHFNALVKRLDHRHLGFDAPELKITTPESMLEFCSDYLSQAGVPPSFVRLSRGADQRYELVASNK